MRWWLCCVYEYLQALNACRDASPLNPVRFLSKSSIESRVYFCAAVICLAFRWLVNRWWLPSYKVLHSQLPVLRWGSVARLHMHARQRRASLQ